MDIAVELSSSRKDPGKHCFDGDSVYVAGSVKNVLVRLAGIDAPEVKGLNLYYLEKSGFLTRLKKQLQKRLEPRLTQESIKIHKQLGIKAREYLKSVLEEELVLSVGVQAFDRYGRTLVYLSGQNEDSYNFKMVKAGYAIPYFIYPNAVSPTEKGEFHFDTLEKIQDAAVKAREDNLGLWEYTNTILLPMELRFLTRREYPGKYCADLETYSLYSPQFYFNVPIENRLFFYRRDVVTALVNGFRPTRDCPEWLHKVWKILHSRK